MTELDLWPTTAFKWDIVPLMRLDHCFLTLSGFGAFLDLPSSRFFVILDTFFLKILHIVS